MENKPQSPEFRNNPEKFLQSDGGPDIISNIAYTWYKQYFISD